MKNLRPIRILAWVIVATGYVVIVGCIAVIVIDFGVAIWRDCRILTYLLIIPLFLGLVALWCWAKDYITDYHKNHYDN